jgi:hypothetical protein
MSAFQFAPLREDASGAAACDPIGARNPPNRLQQFALMCGMFDTEENHNPIGLPNAGLRQCLFKRLLDRARS